MWLNSSKYRISFLCIICFWAHVQELNIIFQPRVSLLRCKLDHVISCRKTLDFHVNLDNVPIPDMVQGLCVLPLPTSPALSDTFHQFGLGPSWPFSFIDVPFHICYYLCLEDFSSTSPCTFMIIKQCK